MSDDKEPFDPRLALYVVVGVTFAFVATIVASILLDRHVDAELYGLMGIVAGGVLGYGVLKR